MYARRPGAGSWLAQLAWALLLCLPPGVRLVLGLWPRTVPGDPETLEALRNERDALARELSAIASEAFQPTLNDPEGTWRRVPADLIPLGDPSPIRSALWVKCRGGRPAPPDSVAFAGSALLGRVVRSWSHLALAQVQTLLDPGFRVRFSGTKSAGMLRGTGKDVDGYPILEVLYLDGDCQFAPGEALYTEGRDGVYPPGLLIGRVESSPAAGGARTRVRAALKIPETSRFEIAVDARREALVQMPESDSSARRRQ